MRQRDDNFRTGVDQVVGQGGGGLHVINVDRVTGARDVPPVVGEAEQADARAFPVNEQGRVRPRQRLPGFTVKHVGQHPDGVAFREFFLQHFRTEIKLMVAEHAEVHPGVVEHRDRLTALEEGAHQARRQEITAGDDHRRVVTRRKDVVDDGFRFREPAVRTVIDRVNFVHVSELQHGQVLGRCRTEQQTGQRKRRQAGEEGTSHHVVYSFSFQLCATVKVAVNNGTEADDSTRRPAEGPALIFKPDTRAKLPTLANARVVSWRPPGNSRSGTPYSATAYQTGGGGAGNMFVQHIRKMRKNRTVRLISAALLAGIILAGCSSTPPPAAGGGEGDQVAPHRHSHTLTVALSEGDTRESISEQYGGAEIPAWSASGQAGADPFAVHGLGALSA